MVDIDKTDEEDDVITDEVIDEPKVDEPKESSVINQLRKQQREAKKEAQRLQAELDRINKEKSDKDKTLEEKLAELEANSNLKAKELSEYKKRSQLEKSLLVSGVDTKLAELLIDKAVENVDDDYSNIEDVIDTLKSDYPQLFVEKQKVVGKVGTSVVGSSKSNKYTLEEVTRLLRDPNTPLTPELDKIAREYGI